MNKFFITTIAILLLCITGCTHDNETSQPTEQSRSILIYMAGDNNLSGYAYDDLKEIKEASYKLHDNHNLLVYVDRMGLDPYMARIKNGEVTDSVGMEESSTADPSVLEHMLYLMRTKYPANSYGLVLWGHSTGWFFSNATIRTASTRAYGVDGSKWMNIPSMSSAIANAMGNEKLMFIFGDCCNFNCIEVAYELRNVADYIIGSPAEIPDDGAPYYQTIQDLFDDSDTFYRSLINHYYDYYVEEFKSAPNYFWNAQYGDLTGYSIPLSVIKTDALDELAQATTNLLNTIPDKLTPQGDLDFSHVTCYVYNSGHEVGYDMSQALRNNTSESAYATWEAVLNKAIVYKRYSQKWLLGSASLSLASSMDTFDSSHASVVSMFFPRTSYNDTYPKWNTTIQQYQWNQIIQWNQYGW